MQEDNTFSFVHNHGLTNFYNNLVENLRTCSEFKISVSFVRNSGVNVLKDVLKELADRNVPGQILASTYLGYTQPKALDDLAKFPNIKLKIYVPNEKDGFHPKGYLFKQTVLDNKEQWTVIIGSSNLSGAALKSNIEWNVLKNDLCGENSEPGPFSKSVLEEFDELWNSRYAKDYSDEFIISYRDYLIKQKEIQKENVKRGIFSFEEQTIKPNDMQSEAIVKLQRLRQTGETKALAIAATGSGKTYMSVFDAMQYKPKKLLFVVHREDILHKAKESFDRVCTDKDYSSGYYTGNKKDADVKYLFATRDTLRNHYTDFTPDEFEYIVVDEAHHATSPSYKTILDYFKPKFLLGLTATPERSDSGDIYSLFDNNIAVEIRLRQALQYGLICPFHYFGLTDVTGIDYSSINPEDEKYLEKVSKMLMISRRVDYILEKVNFYGFDGDKAKILGFCATVEHAKYMATEVNKRLGEGTAVALSGEDSVPVREHYVQNLEDDKNQLQYIFTVDIFNEGIDIPTVNMVLLLRPTDSSIIFIQQLGRGLRKIPDKDFVTVLDFIGNYQKSFLMAIALYGKQEYDKDSLKVAVDTDFADLPGGTYIHMDKIAKEQILRQLDNEKFMSMKYMKESYYSFKKVCGGKVPLLTDYLKHDGSVDPMKFTVFNAQIKTYLEFVAKVEIETHPEFQELLNNEYYKAFIRFLNYFMPLYRLEEFCCIKFLIEKCMKTNNYSEKITIDEIMDLSQKYFEECKHSSFKYAIELLIGLHLGQTEYKSFKNGFCVLNNSAISLNQNLANFLADDTELSRLGRKYLLDTIEYSVLRFEDTFGLQTNDYPFLKLYKEYSKSAVTHLCQTNNIFTPMPGVIQLNEKSYYIFVNLHKGADVKDSINYKDKFITPGVFQWQSPNSTKRDSETGRDWVYNLQRGVTLHLFVRKFEKIEGITQPFMYLGEVITFPDSAEGEKPITMLFALQHRVPDDIYQELTDVVKIQQELPK